MDDIRIGTHVRMPHGEGSAMPLYGVVREIYCSPGGHIQCGIDDGRPGEEDALWYYEMEELEALPICAKCGEPIYDDEACGVRLAETDEGLLAGALVPYAHIQCPSNTSSPTKA